MGLFILVLLPAVSATQSMSSTRRCWEPPQRIRWLIHRYVLRQSMTYFQDEFAGRIATNLMQTALAVRDSAMKVFDVLNYVAFYFVGAVVLAAANDWRLAVPFVLWLVAYGLLLRHFIPRFADISSKQANARALMTGRIVDAYTNISTVKLFSHSQREENYARDAMEEFLPTVYTQMRIATALNISIYTLNLVLLASVFSIGIWLWLGSISGGAIAAAAALVLRFFGMSRWIVWELSACSRTSAPCAPASTPLPCRGWSRPARRRTAGGQGRRVRFDHVGFTTARRRVIDDLSFTPAGREGRAISRSGAAATTSSICCCASMTSTGPSHRGQDISDTGITARGDGVVSRASLLHRSVRDSIVMVAQARPKRNDRGGAGAPGA